MASTVQLFLLSQLLVLGLGTSGVDGYVYSSGPLPRNNGTPKTRGQKNSNCRDFETFESSPRNRNRQDCVNEAFRELRDELRDFNRETTGTKTNGQFDWIAALEQDPFASIDKKTAKKWIEKAFDFAFEFNEDFATVPGEKDSTEEFLKKSREWVSRMYEEDADDTEDDTEEEVTTEDDNGGNPSPSNQSKSPISVETESEEREYTPDPPQKKNSDEIVSEEYLNVQDLSTKDVFAVSFDLPGVDKSDVDVTVDGKVLLVRAQRKTGNDGSVVRLYKATKPMGEEEIDLDKLEASLKNGVLVISAPKKQRSINRKIPVQDA